MGNLARLTGIVAALGLLGGTAVAAAAEGDWSPLVDPARLAALIAAGEPVVVDIRSPAAYGAGHVEGAISMPYPAWRGPEDNPGQVIGDAKLTLNLQQLGIEPDSRVVITYQGRDAQNFGSAARVYWTMKGAGIGHVAILNGGLDAWTASGRALTTVAGAAFRSDTGYTLADTWMLDREGVAAVIDGRSDAVLLDARPEGFFNGREKHDLARWAGTLPGAVNLLYSTWFGAPARRGATFDADRAAVRARLAEVGWHPGQPVVSFCNTGHWAAMNWFALSEVAGIDGVRLYPESMVGWTQARPRPE